MVQLIYAGKAGELPSVTPYGQLWTDLVRETLRRIRLRLATVRISLAGGSGRINGARRYKGLGPLR